MNKKITKALSERNEFIFLLEEELTKNEKSLEEKSAEIQTLTKTIKNLNFLATQPQWDAIIPLGKRIYIPGTIVHTGEYLLEKKSHPYSFQTLATLDQTVDCLQLKRELCRADLEKFNEIEKQLKERLDHLGSKYNVCGLPEKIISDKGIAVRVDEFYEILEFEDN